LYAVFLEIVSLKSSVISWEFCRFFYNIRLVYLSVLQPNPTKGKMRIHCLENVDKSLSFLNEMRVHLENMGAHDIVDGNPRLTLGLIWTIILRFQVTWNFL